MATRNIVSKERKKVLDAVPVTFLQCRTLGHWWFWYDVERHGRKVVQLVRCQKCKAIKFQNLQKDYLLKNSHTNYQAEYRIHGLGHLNRADRAYLRKRFEEYMKELHENAESVIADLK